MRGICGNHWDDGRSSFQAIDQWADAFCFLRTLIMQGISENRDCVSQLASNFINCFPDMPCMKRVYSDK